MATINFTASISAASLSTALDLDLYLNIENDFTVGADSNSDLTISDFKVTFDTMRRDANCYVYKDFGLEFFGDFEIQFEAEITYSVSDALAVVILSDLAGTHQDHVTSGHGLFCGFDNSGGNLSLTLQCIDSATSDTDYMGGSTMSLSYFTFKRSGTTLTFTRYSDAARQTQTHQASVSCVSDRYRYLNCLANRDASGSGDITGRHQQFEITGNSKTFSASISAVSSTSGIDLDQEISFQAAISAASTTSGIDMAGGTVEGALTDGAGLGDSIEAQGPVPASLSDGAGLGDSIAAGGTFNNFITDQAGMGDNVQGGLETNHALTDQAGMGDSAECFNWTEFVRNNEHLFIIKYFLTLTGENDDTTDVEIPISQFQARKRDGEPTYLSATVPGMDYDEEISNRANGQLVIEMAYFVNGNEELREEILRVDLENVRTDEGSVSRTITLSGHRTESFAGQIITIEDPTYKYVSEGIRRYRFAVPEPFLNPGDTVRINDDEFRCGYITYIVSERYRQMEITEA